MPWHCDSTGGPVGFDKATWKADVVEDVAGPSVKMTHVSPDGDQGETPSTDIPGVPDLHMPENTDSPSIFTSFLTRLQAIKADFCFFES